MMYLKQTLSLLFALTVLELPLASSRGLAFVPTAPSQRTTATSNSLLYSSSYSDESSGPSTSMNFAMNPRSDEAKDIVMNRLGLSQSQYKQLAKLADLIVEWNSQINLISRRDCTPAVVFGRHILPSLALLHMDQDLSGKVVDIGTGGGFPGLPLAIALPEVDFLLVDSVGKKLKVVEDIAETLALDNLWVHHGRAEEMTELPVEGRKHKFAYDICVGRSVTSIPKFCFWIQDLLKKPRAAVGDHDATAGGKLMYIIGGDIEEDILTKTDADVTIEDLLQQEGASDKRILVFDQSQVKTIALESGETKKATGMANTLKSQQNAKKDGSKAKTARSPKGAWAKRDNTTPKDRGAANFKRYGY